MEDSADKPEKFGLINNHMARAKYNAQNSHIKLNKKTSQTSRKGRVKMASMNKNKKRDFKPYNRQGHR